MLSLAVSVLARRPQPSSIHLWETDYCRPREANLTALCERPTLQSGRRKDGGFLAVTTTAVCQCVGSLPTTKAQCLGVCYAR
jgi:hypothetical protein